MHLTTTAAASGKNRANLVREDPPPLQPGNADSLRNFLHDLKTPLNGVVMSLELLKTARLTGEPAEWLRSGIQSAEILEKMLMCLETRGKKAGADPGMAGGSLLEVLQAVVAVHRPVAQDKGLKIHFFFSPEVRGRFLFSESHWRRVVGNLLTNAIKFTSAGNVTLNAAIEKADHPDTAGFCLKVEDTGCGIAQEDIPGIYQPFFRGSLPESRIQPGEGLGLSIVKSLLDEMGGRISVESRINQGTTFLVRAGLKRSPSGQV
ncbi:MAG: HAMP domain-containing sensor histidine kinase [Terrimicrobiaceae bacterium]|nr:HAMP domain-containing histidine kinase [Terrimicrobiaceae bacterium]